MSTSATPAASDAAAVGRTAELPRWDLTPLYPSLDSTAFRDEFAAATEAIRRLEGMFEAEGIGPAADPPPAADDGTIERLERLLAAFNDALERGERLGSYLYGLVSTDSKNDAAQARLSELQLRQVALAKLVPRFTAWVGGLDVEAVIDRSPPAAEHAFALRRAREEARHLMSPAEEALAAELDLPGGTAWGKLHDNLTSQISVRLELDGEERSLPMSELRNLALNPEREVRQRAYEAELAAWEGAALPLAAAMNGIKGQVTTLSARRGWQEPLDEAVFANHVDRATLDALLTVARESFPDFRRCLRAKARALGCDALPWFDLFAPVGAAERSWSWPEATAFLEEQFGTYSDRLRGLAARSFAERWIDAEPRANKQGGAYCMAVGDGASRILANYTPSYDAVSTLAHELGHAYHNLNLAGLSPIQRRLPMTLAETASTFCETIVKEAALARAGEAERLYILEQGLQGACQVVVDIVSRFDFERAVFAARRERELSIAELNRLMLDAQAGTYGDGLDPARRHPYMWAVKGHYYSSSRSFYNFPYLFGLLFGLGLYARYREDPVGFRAGYDELLARTGRADAAELAAGWGIDLRTPAFWRASLDLLRADIDRFEEMVDAKQRHARKPSGAPMNS